MEQHLRHIAHACTEDGSMLTLKACIAPGAEDKMLSFKDHLDSMKDIFKCASLLCSMAQGLHLSVPPVHCAAASDSPRRKLAGT